jgi:hypothetical protein
VRKLAGNGGKKLELQLGAKVLEQIVGEIFQASREWETWRPRLGG